MTSWINLNPSTPPVPLLFPHPYLPSRRRFKFSILHHAAERISILILPLNGSRKY
jgi:hypothetical protein